MDLWSNVRVLALTPLCVLAAGWPLTWVLDSSLSIPSVLMGGAAISGLLASAQELLRDRGPRRVALAGVGAGTVFFVVAIALLLWSFSSVDSDQLR